MIRVYLWFHSSFDLIFGFDCKSDIIKKNQINKGADNINESTEIFHIYHSGVAVKDQGNLLIFDYYKDSPSAQKGLDYGTISKADIQEAEEVFVFATHSHYDHYDPKIFDWSEDNAQIHYILSSDIKPNTELDYHEINVGESLKISDFTIKAYGSTDKGVSFLVENDDLSIFHAGDLNWWHWKKFNQQEQQREEREFKAEANKLKGKEIDIAFIPVDPRLEEYYYLAGQYFAEEINPDFIIPIHFRNNYYITEDFADKISDLATKTAIIKKGGKVIDYR